MKLINLIQLAVLKRIKYFITPLFSLLLLSCDASFGEKYTIGNLEIYYTKDVGKHYVSSMGDYFYENNLTQNSKHSVQLTSDSKSFILKMVLNKDHKTLPESQALNLELLETDIKETVFGTANFRIEVCNENFNPIKIAE